MLGLFIGAILLILGSDAAPPTIDSGAEFTRLLDVRHGRAIPVYLGGQFLIAGQLALLILWIRSRSLHDFNGRYRVWGWAATGWGFVGLVTLTGAHRVWGEFVDRHWTGEFWQLASLAWLTPAILAGGMIIPPLRRDMRDCKTSSSLLRLACLFWLAAAIISLEIRVKGYPAEPEPFATAAMLLGTLALCLSMQLHARHVIYESMEPPADSPSWVARIWKSFRRLRLHRKTQAGAKRSTQSKPKRKSAAKSSQKSTSKRSTTNSSSSTKKQPSSPQASSEPDSDCDAESATSDKVPAGESKNDEDTQSGRSDSSDQDHSKEEPVMAGRIGETDEELNDPAALKGLSKRERRRLRKQQRTKRSA